MNDTSLRDEVESPSQQPGPLFDLDEPRRLQRPHDADAEARALAAQAIAAFAAGGQPSVAGADEKHWVLAVEELVRQRALDAAARLVPALAAAFPALSYFRTMSMVLAQTPRPVDDPGFTAFADDPEREVQTVRRRGGGALLIVFSGTALKAGLPFNILHRWFAPLGVHVVYLRDFRRLNYDHGVPTLAPDYRGTVRALHAVTQEFGTGRILCFGNSLGGYAALRYALDLGAEAVLSFAGPTNLSNSLTTPEFRRRLALAEGLDLLPLYRGAARPPRVHLVYGDGCAEDVAQAQNFAGLPTATLAAAAGWPDHNVFLYALQQRTFADHLAWLADPLRSASGPELARD